MNSIKYFTSQVYVQDCEITQREAEARGIFVRAFLDVYDNVCKAEVVRDGKIVEVVYHDVADEHVAGLSAGHRSAYPGIPFWTVGRIMGKNGERQQCRQRFDVNARMTEIVIDELDERGELLVEIRKTPDGKITSRREYEYDAHGDIAGAREYDSLGRLVDEYERSD